MKEPPPTLLSAHHAPLDAHWYAVCVGSRHERVVAAHLAARGLRFFLPVYRSVRRWRDRRKELEMALFPGYIFVNLDLRQRLRVLQAPGVLRFVSFQGQPARVEGVDLDVLGALHSASGSPVKPHPYLQQGKRVKVVNGPLLGARGILLRRKDRFRLVISVEMIMRSVLLEVDEADVLPA